MAKATHGRIEGEYVNRSHEVTDKGRDSSGIIIDRVKLSDGVVVECMTMVRGLRELNQVQAAYPQTLKVGQKVDILMRLNPANRIFAEVVAASGKGVSS